MGSSPTGCVIFFFFFSGKDDLHFLFLFRSFFVFVFDQKSAQNCQNLQRLQMQGVFDGVILRFLVHCAHYTTIHFLFLIDKTRPSRPYWIIRLTMLNMGKPPLNNTRQKIYVTGMEEVYLFQN